MNRIKVMVVDDHALFRQGIISVLKNEGSLEVVGEATNGLEAIKAAEEKKPDVIVMDLNMPKCTGLEATQALQTEFPQINILVLTVSEKEEDLFAAMKFGAKGYILKNTEPEELVLAILHIARGGVIVSPAMATKLLGEFKDFEHVNEPEPVEGANSNLTPREKDILQLLAQGATNKQIASSLFISENTVKTHLRNIMDKLHIANRSQAAAYAVSKGLVKFDE